MPNNLPKVTLLVNSGAGCAPSTVPYAALTDPPGSGNLPEDAAPANILTRPCKRPKARTTQLSHSQVPDPPKLYDDTRGSF